MNKKSLVGLIICAILAIFGLAINVIGMFSGEHILSYILTIVVYILIFCYAAFGYKVPHGNLLKWLMLIVALSALITLKNEFLYANSITFIFWIIAPLCLAYAAGRLNKIEENYIVLGIALALVVTVTILNIVTIAAAGNADFITISVFFNPLFFYTCISCAYFSRYAEHKEIGQYY